jgi:signal peptidase I
VAPAPSAAPAPDFGLVLGGGAGGGAGVVAGAPPSPPRAVRTEARVLQAAPAATCDAPEEKPKVVHFPKPAYPESERASGVQGKVKVQISLDPTGRVLEAVVTESLGPVFDALAGLPLLSERARAAFAEPAAITVAKANMRSTVHRPQHADVIVFDWPVDPGKAFVKRLVGLAGDTLAMQNGVLQRNGVTVREPYLLASRSTAASTLSARSARDSWGPVVVPSRHFFVLGDNRTNSLDSRYWGFVPDSLLRGAPWFVYYSFSPDSTQHVPWLTRIRWTRLGTAVR